MPTSPELTSARDLAYQGVGRNLLQFQRLEHLLKFLLGFHQGYYTPETMVDEMKRRQEAKDKKTLGGLAGYLFKKVILQQDIGDAVLSDDKNTSKISHWLGMTIPEKEHQELQCRLKALVDERNQLVHLSLLAWNLDTIEDCQAIVAELDEQLGRIKTEVEQVKGYYETFDQFMKLLREEWMDG
jgi:hypothetical protein